MNVAAIPSAIRSRMVHSVRRLLQIAPLFEAATGSRARTSGNVGSTDSRVDVSRLTRTTLTGAARWLFNNEGVLRGICWDMARYSFGAHGLRPQSDSGNPDFDDAAEEFWNSWCRVADASGKHHFNTLQLLLSVSMDRDGDVGIKLSKSATEFPQIQIIESHRIGSSFERESDGWFDGVKLNEVGRPVAYRIYERGNTTRTDAEPVVEIPANDFILLYDPQRADETRGKSAFTHGILHLHDKKDILGFEKTAVKVNSAWPAVLKKKGGNADAADWNAEGQSTKDSATKLNLAQITEGQMPVIDADEELIQWLQSRPGATFSGFLDYLIREVNIGLGLPPEFTWDPSKMGGTSQRFILAKAQRRFEERQQLFINKVLNRLWFWVISVAVKRGDIVLPAGAKPWKVKWQAPSELTVDAGRDAKADREDVLSGLMTRAEHYGRRGRDWETEHDQLEREAEDILTRAGRLAIKHDISIDAALGLMQQRGPNPAPLEEPEPKPSPNDEPNSDSSTPPPRK